MTGRRGPNVHTDPPSYLVTTAPRSPHDDQRERQRRYLITMGVRLVMFIAAVVLFSTGLKAAAAVTAAASLILPWVAVVLANSGPRKVVEQPSLHPGRQADELPGPDARR